VCLDVNVRSVCPNLIKPETVDECHRNAATYILWMSVGGESSRYMRTDGHTERQVDGQADRYDETNRRFRSFLRKCLKRKEQCTTDVKEEKYTQGAEEITLKRIDIWTKEIQQLSVRASHPLHRTTHHQHPDNRHSVFRDLTTKLKGCTTFADISVSDSSPNIVLLRNGKIPDFILGVNPAVGVLDAVFIACCSSSKELWDSALLRHIFYWAHSQNEDNIQIKQGFPCLASVLVTK
jgi:hypothetical protein